MAGLTVGDVAILASGARIYVDPASGDDGTGDGSAGSPYETVGRGIQDVTSGRGDTVFLLGDTAEAPVLVDAVDGWNLVGLGNPTWSPVTSPTSLRRAGGFGPNVSGTNVNGQQKVQLASHGLSTGDVVIVGGGIPNSGGAGTQPIYQGALLVQTVLDANRFRVNLNSVGALQGHSSFYDFDTEPLILVPPLSLKTCNGVNIVGIAFSDAANIIGDGWSGLALYKCSRINLNRCRFSNASLGLTANFNANRVPVFTGQNDGSAIVVQDCLFSFHYDNTGFFSSLRPEMAALYWSAHDAVMLQCIFASFLVNGSLQTSYLDEGTGHQGVVSVSRFPKLGAVLADNLMDQWQSDDGFELFLDIHDTAATATSRFYARRNFFVGQDTGEPVDLTSGGTVQDDNPSDLPRQGFVENLAGSVWSARSSVFNQPGSFGSLLTAVSGDVAAVSGNVDTLSGSLAAVSGDLATLDGVVDTVSGDLAVTSGNVTRLYGGNTRTRLFYATSGASGRNVASGAASHMEVSIKGEAAADWSSPSVHYVVFKYESGAEATTPPAVAVISGSAPTDGAFTAEDF